MEAHDPFQTRIARATSSRRRAALVPMAAMMFALTTGCGGSTEPTIASVPADKVPPKQANPVPTAKKHGPKYGVSPQIDLNAAKG